jgi:hypothetical protein
MNKLLQNPIVVVLLAALAGYFVYVNLLQPVWGAPQKVKSNPELPESVVITEPLLLDTVGQPNTQDSSALDGLRSIGFKRKANRNPFLRNGRNGSVPYWVLSPQEKQRLDSLQQANRHAVKARAKSRSTPTGVATQGGYAGEVNVIAIGSKKSLAVLGKRKFNAGDPLMGFSIEAIYADSVRLRNASGSRVLPFSPAFKKEAQPQEFKNEE